MGKRRNKHGLGERGLALYNSYVTADTPAPKASLALEAARIADRLDELNDIIQGKGVLNLMKFRVLDKELSPDEEDLNILVELKFQTPLSEARQQSIAFSGLIKTLEAMDSPAEKPAEPEKERPTGESELAKKRAERERLRKEAQ